MMTAGTTTTTTSTATAAQQLDNNTTSIMMKSRTRTTMDENVLLIRTADVESSDGRIHNEDAVRKIRETWIYKQIRSRQDEFTQYRQAKLFVGTWNVNAKGKDEPLDDWICADWGTTGQPDIVAVGFQEIVDLNAVNVAVDNKTQQKSAFWVDRIQTTLNGNNLTPNDPYVLIMQKSMVGLLICVFVQHRHIRRVNHVHATSVGVGVLGMGGNKGGVSIRLQFYDSTLCFVCTHLAAHRENVTGRNNDYMNVLNKTCFDVGEAAVVQIIRNGSLAQWTPGSSTVGLPDHDIIVWLGDLNYRIDESMQTDTVLELATKNRMDDLLHLDQLNIERKAGKCFHEFEETPIRFPPTYKYQPGTDGYDIRPEKKIRAPAWCDRILWRTADDASKVQPYTYNRSIRPNVSDHKAVYSTMQITIKDVIVQQRDAIHHELMKLLDRFENQTLPVIGLDKDHIMFPPVRYEEVITLPLQITNTGSVVAQFRFVPKPDEIAVCKPWLSISHMYGLLIPGEKPLTINITIKINKEIAQSLNSGREVLDDILILRLEKGRDYYLTVHADYARSCFGMSVDELVLYPDPIRTIPLDPLERSKKMESIRSKGSTALGVPKELWRILDAIYEKGLAAPHLFIQRGVPSEIQEIRECLDTGTPFGQQYQIYSYTDALTSFLSSFPYPIIPIHLCPNTEVNGQNIQMFARRLLEELPPIHYNIFIYMLSFFREVIVHKDQNHLTSFKVAGIASSCLFAQTFTTTPGTLPTTTTTTTTTNDNNNNNNQPSTVQETQMRLVLDHMLETNSI